jgi:hypothetical protein
MKWIIVAGLALGGCETTISHYRNAQHPSYAQAEYDRDSYECRRENQHQVVEAWGGIAEANTVVNKGMAAACMQARGWRKVSESPG